MARGGCLEGGIEQQEALEDGESERLVGLMQPSFALPDEVPGHVAVGDDSHDGDRHDGAAHEEQEQSTAESALQRFELERHMCARSEMGVRHSCGVANRWLVPKAILMPSALRLIPVDYGVGDGVSA